MLITALKLRSRQPFEVGEQLGHRFGAYLNVTMSALGVVEHLRNLAADPQNRATIVKDQGCLAGLVLFLDNEDVIVVITALEALKFLSEFQPNRSKMREEIGMVISLKTIMHKEGYHSKAKQLANEVYQNIISSVKTPSSRRASEASQSFFLGNLNKRAKVVTLHIKGLANQVTRKLCEEELLKVKGVISFTFVMNKSRCIVRCKLELTPETLCDTINNTKVLSAQQVIKNERGEEVMLSFGKAPAKSYGRGNSSALPDYLPEDDEDTVISDKAITRVGDDKENGWFSSVTSFFSKTLYW